jgi:hypothetical protein
MSVLRSGLKSFKFSPLFGLAAALVVLIVVGAFYFSGNAPQKTTAVAPNNATQEQKAREMYARLPLSFELNQGQHDSAVRFKSGGAGYSLFLTANEAVLSLRKPSPTPETATQPEQPQHFAAAFASQPVETVALKMRTVGGNLLPEIGGVEELPGKTNYFSGSDPANWQRNIPNYRKVLYKGVYPGIDQIFYGNQAGQLQYDFIVAPQADPARVRLAFDGAEKLEILPNGDLALHLDGQVLLQNAPVLYQEIGGERKSVTGKFRLLGTHEVGFDIGSYDPSHTLVIDPALSYSTYLGGSGGNYVSDIAVDHQGQMYITGGTDATDFPGNSQPITPYNTVTYVAKFNAAGDSLLYSSFIRSNHTSGGANIVVDDMGQAYISGGISPTNYATTTLPVVNAFQPTSGGDIESFVAKLSSSGDLLLCSFLGGLTVEYINGINIDADKNIYLAGFTASPNFPVKNAFQSQKADWNTDGFITKINSANNQLEFSTFFGGVGFDSIYGLDVNPDRQIYVSGVTYSNNFPLKNALQNTNKGENDFFVSKFNSNGQSLVYSTYLGGSKQEIAPYYASQLALDSSGNAYITGATNSTDYPLRNPFQAIMKGKNDLVVTKLNSDASAILYSTYLGSEDAFNYYEVERSSGITVDAAGKAYIIGATSNRNFPLRKPFQISNNPTIAEKFDGYIGVLNADGSDLVFGSYFGGSDITQPLGLTVDTNGKIYIVGGTAASNFPVVNAYQPLPKYMPGGGIRQGFILVTGLSGFASEPAPGSSLNFGLLQAGTPVTRTIVVTSTEMEAGLYIPRVEITGTNAADFRLLSPSVPMTFSVGATKTLVIECNPNVAGTTDVRTATLKLTTSADNIDTPSYNLVCNTTQQGTSLSLTSAPNPSTFGQEVVFTATINPAVASGTVTFTQGATVLGTATLTNGTAVFTKTNFAVGTHVISATYGGSNAYLGSTSNNVTQVVEKAPTTLTLTNAPNPSIVGGVVTFTATISPATASGMVTFTQGATVLGTTALNNGVAVFTKTNFSVGSHVISATYGGNNVYIGSVSNSVTQIVEKVPTIVTLTSAPNPSIFGQAVVFTASINPVAASGTVTFTEGAIVLGTAELSNGLAVFTKTDFTIGSHVISATYGGNTTYSSSVSNDVTQIVEKVPTTLALTSAPNPSLVSQVVTFTATINPAVASGTVTFTEGATVLGTAMLNGGTAVFTKTDLSVGSHVISATYGGDTNYLPGTSNTITQVVVADCLPFKVTLAEDNGAGTVCGTLSYALDKAVTVATPVTITLEVPGNAITLTNSLTKTVPPGVVIQGNDHTINGNGVAGEGLQLSGDNLLVNLTIRGFGGREIVIPPGRNRLDKVRVLP